MENEKNLMVEFCAPPTPADNYATFGVVFLLAAVLAATFAVIYFGIRSDLRRARILRELRQQRDVMAGFQTDKTGPG